MTTIPLTPNLKHSDPQNSRLYEDKHIFKRSNSQNEFDFLTGHSSAYGLLDFNEPMMNLNSNQIDHDFIGTILDHHMGHPSLQNNLPMADKLYSTPFPFHALSATGLGFNNTIGAN